MKKKFLLIAMLLISISAVCQTKVSVSGNVFTSVHDSTTKANKYAPTVYKWHDSEGKEYVVYLSELGKYFVIRTSKKTGNTYKQYFDVAKVN